MAGMPPASWFGESCLGSPTVYSRIYHHIKRQLCVFEREREGRRGRKKEKERERERGYVRKEFY